MSPWINSGNYVGVDLNPGGLSVILSNYTDAVNERFDLFSRIITRPTYHTNNGDIVAPVADDFVGMDFAEIPQTLDDIEIAITQLCTWGGSGDKRWVDPNSLDTPFTVFGEVALEATGSATRPSVNTTDKALWNFYKDTINLLNTIRFVKTAINVDPGGQGRDRYIDIDVVEEDAWDNMLAVDPPGNTGAGVAIVLTATGIPFPSKYQWIVVDDGDLSYDFGLPAGGTILKDKLVIKPLGVDDFPGINSGTLSHDFEIAVDDPTGPTRTLTVTTASGDETYEGTAPTLFGLIQSGGTINFQVDFANLPADSPWGRPPPASGEQESSFVLVEWRSPVATIWIDYTSELVFV